jgi:hypothetical protein
VIVFILGTTRVRHHNRSETQHEGVPRGRVDAQVSHHPAYDDPIDGCAPKHLVQIGFEEG